MGGLVLWERKSVLRPQLRVKKSANNQVRDLRFIFLTLALEESASHAAQQQFPRSHFGMAYVAHELFRDRYGIGHSAVEQVT